MLFSKITAVSYTGIYALLQKMHRSWNCKDRSVGVGRTRDRRHHCRSLWLARLSHQMHSTRVEECTGGQHGVVPLPSLTQLREQNPTRTLRHWRFTWLQSAFSPGRVVHIQRRCPARYARHRITRRNYRSTTERLWRRSSRNRGNISQESNIII